MDHRTGGMRIDFPDPFVVAMGAIASGRSEVVVVFLSNIIRGLAWVIGGVLDIYFFIVIGSAILSFVNPDPYNPIVRFLRNATEPIYRHIRYYLPFIVMGGFDLSPIVVIFAIKFLDFAIVQNLVYLATVLVQNSPPG
jgi:YggT family protein